MIEGMNVRVVEDKIEWHSVIGIVHHPSFLQSWEWGEFQGNTGKKPIRLVVGHECLQGFVHTLPLGMHYLYIPRPSAISKETLREVFAYAQRAGHAFIRFEGGMPEHTGLPVHPGVVRQPRSSLLLSLDKSRDELLLKMHQKTRYNIRLAEKKGIIVKEEKNAGVFWSLLEETTARDSFGAHGKAYYEHMLALPVAYQFTAYLGEIPLASNICVSYGGTMTYLHGASGNTHRELMAPYLLQWTAIQKGKAFGCDQYDFWGVAPPDAIDHPWQGITRFKTGFGGTYVEYPAATDIICKPLAYKAYRFVQTLRRIL